VQQAWAAEQVSQCGYCEPGFIMAIAALLRASPSPDAAAVSALPNICRCGAYPRIRRAIARAAAASAPRPPDVPGRQSAAVRRNGVADPAKAASADAVPVQAPQSSRP
jgi:isoquinoline 1-oxidoreductase alpha subunit